jgi:hypothetical protein
VNKISYRGCKKKGHKEKDYWFMNNHQRCYNCGDTSYRRNSCSKLQRFAQENSTPQVNTVNGRNGANNGGICPNLEVKARVFALGRNELEVNLAVEEGTLTS